jgi:transposase
MTLDLFPDMPERLELAPAPPTRPSQARVVRAVRNQVEWMPRDLDSLLAEEHPARSIWALLERLDLSGFYASIKAVMDRPGHPATDPRVLLALWVYATVDGVGSARKLDRLSQEHDAYRWLRGGAPINYHLLSDFRTAHQQALDELLTQIVATMMATGLVTLKEVAQDGLRVGASAGAGSFRRRATLEKCLEVGGERVERLAKEREQPDPGMSQRERAAGERAARERQERVEEALRQLPEVQAAKERQAKRAGKERAARIKEARTSTTDPDARIMKMADGGFRPAFNVQLATDKDSQVITGVSVINHGADQGEALPVEEQVAERADKHPEAYLMDGGFVDLEDIATLEQRGVTVYAPPKESNQSHQKKAGRRAAERPEVIAWRERMQTEQAKAIYKHRAATAECANAQFRERYGVHRFLVRGLAKVTCLMFLAAISHDLMRWIALSS